MIKDGRRYCVTGEHARWVTHCEQARGCRWVWLLVPMAIGLELPEAECKRAAGRIYRQAQRRRTL
ncbi:MAG TPA: hypothetical protein VK586_07460 [Streptosporangiaceae bacterium]|nr:hypothetical protein [Streptosporangiaceae bacterium]